MPKARRPYSPRMGLDERREQLLDAALQIIGRDGYEAVSIEAIAREADVTRPVVYRVFDDLDALLFTLLDRQEQRALDRLLATITPTPDAADLATTVATAVRGLLTMIDEDPLTWRSILLTHHGTPAAVRRRIDRDRELVRRRIQDGVELALAARAPAPALDSLVLSHMLIAIAEHFGRLLLDRPDAVDPDRLTATVTALLTGGRG